MNEVVLIESPPETIFLESTTVEIVELSENAIEVVEIAIQGEKGEKGEKGLDGGLPPEFDVDPTLLFENALI